MDTDTCSLSHQRFSHCHYCFVCHAQCRRVQGKHRRVECANGACYRDSVGSFIKTEDEDEQLHVRRTLEDEVYVCTDYQGIGIFRFRDSKMLS